METGAYERCQKIMGGPMTVLKFACPECRETLDRAEKTLSCKNQHVFAIRAGVYDLLPRSVSALTLEEAKYHSEQKETWAEQNQIYTERNLSCHRSLLDAIAAHSTATSNILEIGGGVGFDLRLFLEMHPRFQHYVFSEVSEELVAAVASRFPSSAITCCMLDAQRIPFADGQFDCVFMIAALHHLPDMSGALGEMARVTKTGGVICCGVEPNRWWLSLMRRLKWLIRTVLPPKEHSAADEQAEGLSAQDFVRLGEMNKLKLLRCEPIWLLCGILHYGLEFTYRLVRLKKRLQLPTPIERAMVRMDRVLLRIPGLRNLSWHHSAIYQKL